MTFYCLIFFSMPNLATCDKLIAKFLQCVIFLCVMCSKTFLKLPSKRRTRVLHGQGSGGWVWAHYWCRCGCLKARCVLLAFLVPPPSCSLRSPTWQGLQMGCARRRGWRQPCDGNVNLLCRPGEAPGNSPRNAFCSAGPRGGICHRHPAAARWRALSLSTPTAFN